MKWTLLVGMLVVVNLIGCALPIDCADCDNPVSGPSVGTFTFDSSITGIQFYELIGIGDPTGNAFTDPDEINQKAEYQLSPGDARILWTYIPQVSRPNVIVVIESAEPGYQRVYDFLFTLGELSIYDWLREFD